MYLRLCISFLLAIGSTTGQIKNIGWWRNTVFYQIYPRSFMDSNGDGLGDLKGITSKLKHFVESGIDGIWLSPIYASPMVDFGYDISDFRKIDKTFGTMNDFEALIQVAHKLGIKVVLDFVPNHTSDKHEWFIKSCKGIGKYKNYYMWHEGRKKNTVPPNNWISVFSGSAWTFNKDRNSWYFHQFEYRQPDLNFSNPDVVQEMEDVLQFWLDKGVDGFRIDAVPHIFENDQLLDEPLSHAVGATEKDHAYLNHTYTMNDPRIYPLIQSWRDFTDGWSDSHNQDEKVIMTEAYQSLEQNILWYNYGVHIPFDFKLITDVSNTSKPSDFKKVIEDWLTRMPSHESPNWVMGNHDRRRIATRYPGRADEMTMLSMILPGVSVTYYGEEIDMVDKMDISWEDTQDPQACNSDKKHYMSQTRDPQRTPFQWNDSPNAGFSTASKTWLPVHENYKKLNLETQKVTPQSPYKLYQALTSLRRRSDSMSDGKTIIEALDNDSVLAVVRQGPTEGTVLLINFSDNKSKIINCSKYLPKAKKPYIHATSVGSGIRWGTPVDVSKIILPPKVSLVVNAQIGWDH